MTIWKHKCSLDWLKARQKCLTATDVKDLLPVTKTGRKRTIDDEDYLKVYARKLMNLTEDDCYSSGAAARGHILEPYAIEMFNDEAMLGGKLHHWDDVIITRFKHKYLDLAFSPDACDANPSCVSGRHVACVKGINCIAEVKCYSPERHLICGHTPKEELEERWQIATAMAVCNDIETAYLLFYNPSMMDQLYVIDYDRADLVNEISMVVNVEANWCSWINDINKLDFHFHVYGDADHEQDIINQIMKHEELSPDDMKTVRR